MKAIAYYRVSTAKQGKSGLGLEGQQAALESFLQQQSGSIIATYQEVESGKKSDRPELTKAVAHARRSKATLVVAKLDRLSRNVVFLSTLLESGVDFVACDNPHANKFTIHILAAVAEHEAEAISQRTKAALQAAKRRGMKLGSARPGHWKGREHRRHAGAIKGAQSAKQSIERAANEAYTDLYPMLTELKSNGRTLQQIADKLNESGHTTRHGKSWYPSQVLRVLKRAK